MTGNNCQPTTATLAQQVANPIPGFATDNNGYIMLLTPSPHGRLFHGRGLAR